MSDFDKDVIDAVVHHLLSSEQFRSSIKSNSRVGLLEFYGMKELSEEQFENYTILITDVVMKGMVGHLNTHGFNIAWVGKHV